MKNQARSTTFSVEQIKALIVILKVKQIKALIVILLKVKQINALIVTLFKVNSVQG